MSIAVFGDSNVVGWRPDAPRLMNKKKTWPYLLQELTGTQLHVNGIPGRSALPEAQNLQTFSIFLDACKDTDMFILMLGVNDLPHIA